MTRNVVPMGSDFVARNLAQSALNGLGALGSLARQDGITVAQIADPENLPAGEGMGTISWFTGSPPSGLAMGVAMSNGSPTFTNGALVLAAGGNGGTNLAKAGDPITQLLALVHDELGGIVDTEATITSITAGETVNGHAAWTMATSAGNSGVSFLDLNAPAMAAGEHVWVVFWVKGAGTPAILFTDDSTPPGGQNERCVFDLGVGASVSGEGSTIMEVGGSAGDEWSMTALGGGQHRIAVKMTVAAGQSLAAGTWAVGVTNQSTSTPIVFTQPVIVKNAPEPTVWAAPGVSFGGGSQSVVVADPSVGGHQSTLPFALVLEADAPKANGTLMEVVGTNVGGTGNLVVRVVVASGALRLTVTEDDGISTKQATLPTGAWPLGKRKTVALRLIGDEAVLYLDGYSMTGLPLASTPQAITGYRVGGQSGDTDFLPLTLAAIADRPGFEPEGDQLRVMTTAEVGALATQLAGRLYVEH